MTPTAEDTANEIVNRFDSSGIDYRVARLLVDDITAAITEAVEAERTRRPLAQDALRQVVSHLQFERGMTDDESIQNVIAPALDGRGGPVAAVLALMTEHNGTWREQPESYWLAQLHEEIAELTLTLHGKHQGPVEWELEQIAAICLNWLDMRATIRARGTSEQEATR